MKSDLENLLLQAAGRTGGGSSSRAHAAHGSRSNSRKDKEKEKHRYSKESSSSDSEPNPRIYSKKDKDNKDRRPKDQVPLKKRPSLSVGDEEDDSDSDAPSVGSDLYRDDADKEHLLNMTELDREMILAERGSRIDDYKLKKLAMGRTPPSRSSARGAEKSAATRTALNELAARRKRQQDPEGYRNRLKHLAGSTASLNSPPSDPDLGAAKSDTDDDDDRKDDELPDDLKDIQFDDIRDITILRSRLLKWFMDPFFDELLPGCFVRLGIHQGKDGNRKYRLYTVRSVDASDPDRTYKFEHYTTSKYLLLVTRTESSVDKIKMSEVSDSPPSQTEFQEWLQLAESNGMHIPTRHELAEKKEAIQGALNFVYSAQTVKQLLQDKKLASLRPANVAAEKDRLRKELEVARARLDEPGADRILTRLKQLEQMQPKKVDSKAARLAEMNRRNRAENFKNASEVKPVNMALKAGEAGYDPFSRRWTRSRNYYMSKPDVEELCPNTETDDSAIGKVLGLVETAAALEAAAGAGKLVDTKAPLDPRTVMYDLHNFEVRIDLTKLQELGSTPSERVFRGRLLRRQRQEMTIGHKVPESDGKRHPLTLSVSDYKRRRGLL